MYGKNDLNSDIDGRPFAFHFDESTNQRVKKQYDDCVIFYSVIEKSIVTAHYLRDIICWTLLFSRLTQPLLQIF